MEKNGFKRYLLCLKRGFSILIIILIIGLLLGLWISSLTYKPKYRENNQVELQFKYTTPLLIDEKDIISDDTIERCKKLTKSLETGSQLKTYQYVTITTITIEKNDTGYILTADKDAFNVGSDLSYNDAAAKGFLKHLTILPLISDEEIEQYTQSDTKGHAVFDNFDKDYYKANSLDQDGKIHILEADLSAKELNQKHKICYYCIWMGSLALGFLAISLLVIFIFKDKLSLDIKYEYNNETIYRTPFHISFFKQSANSFKNIKILCTIAILLSLVLISKLLPIPSGFGNLGVSFAYLFLSVACMIAGPIPALVIGALSDILGYLIKPDGMFFIGYTFQSMLACFTYGMCFYKTHITYSKCLIARVIVNFLCNVILGSICWGIISGFTVEATISYMTVISLPKNLIYLLPQSIILFLILKALAKPMEVADLLDEEIASSISFF